jgi:predicted membrane channel-forming protein YqfA (hemolysin III family)
MSLATVRNIAIVLVIAALVAVIPGGGRGATTALQAVSLVFLATLGWFAAMMYRQHRATLYGLGERRRALLYVALGVAAVTLTGTTKLWSSPGGSVAWLVLIGGAVYTVFAIFWAARRY